tara:strand:+ start:339 stop:824 length:486 start_codon:yes stop_codon:yes gene_type:complete
MKDITVIDDFFNEKELNILVNNLNRINFGHQQNKKGDKYGFGHGFEENKENIWLFDKIKKKLFKDTNLKAVDCSFRLRHNSEKMLPHDDPHVNYIFLAYLKGKELMYNGTGFYNDDTNLDRYVGFKENRIIFYNSFIYHSDLQSLGESSPRYTLNIFYKNE